MWMLIQNDPPDESYDGITFDVYKGFQAATLSVAQDDPDNAFGLGLNTKPAARNLQSIFDDLVPYLDSVTAIGRLAEVT